MVTYTVQPALKNEEQATGSVPIRILIVDDEPGTLQLLRMVLQADGNMVHEARDGLDAIAEFDRTQPALVLLGIMLPKADGLDVLRVIREKDAVVGVMMISALSSEQLAVRAMLGGADDYLSKPLSLKTLRLRIRQVLDRVQLRRQNLRLQQQLVTANEKLSRYMAPPLIASLLASPSPPILGGERKLITVLFLDFCNSTSVTNNYPPDEVVRLLNDYFALMTTSVIENGGYLDKIMGDGLMALFNVPEPYVDHAMRAVRCALEIRRQVRTWNDTQATSIPQLQIRVGIHTGEAVVGNIGTSNLMTFTAIGRAVNLAKRLEEEACPGQILISEATSQQLDRQELGAAKHQIEPLGRRRLQGFEQPLELLQLVDVVAPAEFPAPASTPG